MSFIKFHAMIASRMLDKKAIKNLDQKT